MIDTTEVIQVASALAAGLVGMAFGLQKLFKGWKETSAETSVIKLMHGELERLAKQNTVLSTELGKLQTEILALNTQIQTLSLENQRLHQEVSRLTAQLDRSGPSSTFGDKLVR